MNLALSIPPLAGHDVAHARFVHDGRAAAGSNARATLRIGGALVGQLSTPASVPGAETQAWVRSALSIPVAAIAANNAIQLQLDPGFYIDRMEVELAYSSQAASDLLFADGFDPAATLEPPAILARHRRREEVADRALWRTGRQRLALQRAVNQAQGLEWNQVSA
ncbi:MAG: hypothetical protein IPK54_07915 [Dokdonella sp.]|uniref:hypothetical protein n=1 Tax=Dokdonella sp. TaxID=2291710 RepID=UPI0025C269FD|nr:hypothetical protein [Dokdonella sp.]MBK8123468.1 hypothetical protein [Dokdonella sp.]